MPLVVPIGPMYWDTYIYLDAAHRISTGQIPSVDFSTPVGPLGYYLFAWGLDLFPKAQPLLLAQWSILLVAAPLMAIVLTEISSRSRPLAFALLVPFLIFAVSPANAQFYHAFAGLDGFGIYNRQGVILLYLLTSGLLFLRDGRKLAVFCAAAMLALFLTKITGFLVGGLFGLLALLAGRISWTNLFLAAAVFLASVVVIEAGSGLISAYLADIVQLASMNQEALLPRFKTVVSAKLDVLLPAAMLSAILCWIDWTRPDRSIRFFDRSFSWFSVAVVGGIVYETQNTGSQEFIFLWPVLLMIFARVELLDSRARLAFVTLAAFCVIPTFATVAHKTLRAVAVLPTHARMHLPAVKNLQQVSQRQEIIDRATYLETHYQNYASAYADLSDHGQLPSWQYYSELDFQLYWIISANSLVESLKTFEVQNNVWLDSLMNLDFTNPFPWLLDRDATKHIQIGADPDRTVPPLNEEAIRSIAETAAVLRPKCPLTTGRRLLFAHYEEALKGRTLVEVHPCWDLLLRPDILAKKQNKARP
ncbi:hypothetical protein IB238_22070 [Rhizobium sp. ARZ01]|nr:hypothetical protein [Rhizobium sp. ARZ01]MBD9375313.1 hypothetical protein [Rhizobium sp. ARZ01]